MILLLVLLAGERLYHPETIDSLRRTTATHVQVQGRVTLVRTEADGDVHIRLMDVHGHIAVAEIVPTLHPDTPFVIPRRGQIVIVRGIRRYDSVHRWTEIHPVEMIRVVP